MRKLVTIRKIDEIRPIEGADAIEVAILGGWQVVIKKGSSNVGDLVAYAEIDSWIPTELAPFLSKGKEPREFEGVKGERLRTVKMRGALSQGLLIDLFTVAEYCKGVVNSKGIEVANRIYSLGDDISEVLGVKKWEATIPAQLAGQVKGNFPSAVPRTDQERCISAGTLITTNVGFVPIEVLCENYHEVSVLTFNHATYTLEYKKIIDASVMTRRKGWVKIKTKMGKELIVTTNHKIWIDNLGAYREAKDIKEGDVFISS